MLKKQFSLLLTSISILLIILGGIILMSTNTTPPPATFEIENLIHKTLDYKIDKDDLPTFDLYKGNSSSEWLFLFISEAKNCSNCLNEITDYVELASNIIPFKNNHETTLVYHGLDSLKATHFIRSSGVQNIVKSTLFVHSTKLSRSGIYGLMPEYVPAGSLYLVNKKEQRIIHGFVLASGKTTKLNKKIIALKNAVNAYNTNK